MLFLLHCCLFSLLVSHNYITFWNNWEKAKNWTGHLEALLLLTVHVYWTICPNILFSPRIRINPMWYFNENHEEKLFKISQWKGITLKQCGYNEIHKNCFILYKTLFYNWYMKWVFSLCFSVLGLVRFFSFSHWQSSSSVLPWQFSLAEDVGICWSEQTENMCHCTLCYLTFVLFAGGKR